MFDSNMDGKVSQKEIPNLSMGRTEPFKRRDLNGDGYLELSEVGPAGGPPMMNSFDAFKQAFDVDRDGKVSKYEMSGFPSFLEGQFTSWDKNKDGYVVESEYSSPGGGKGGKMVLRVVKNRLDY